MKLKLTQYIDANPGDVTGRLKEAVGQGLDAAATRVSAHRDDTMTEAFDGGIRVERGLGLLDGSELRVSGSERLTTLEIAVPWTAADSGTKLLAANAFANTVANEIRPAA